MLAISAYNVFEIFTSRAAVSASLTLWSDHQCIKRMGNEQGSEASYEGADASRRTSQIKADSGYDYEYGSGNDNDHYDHNEDGDRDPSSRNRKLSPRSLSSVPRDSMSDWLTTFTMDADDRYGVYI